MNLQKRISRWKMDRNIKRFQRNMLRQIKDISNIIYLYFTILIRGNPYSKKQQAIMIASIKDCRDQIAKLTEYLDAIQNSIQISYNTDSSNKENN